jgi:putative Holliday junction resolvase
MRGRCLGLDVGDKRIGVAVSDELGISANAVEVIQRQEGAGAIARLLAIVKEYEVSQVVVGLPRMMDGSVGIQANKVMEFTDHLKESLSVPVEYWDERLSTLAAEQVLIEANVRREKRKKVIDKLAAVVILQSYLDSQI